MCEKWPIIVEHKYFCLTLIKFRLEGVCEMYIDFPVSNGWCEKVSIQVSKDMKEKLKEKSSRENRSVSSIIRDAIKEALDE